MIVAAGAFALSKGSFPVSICVLGILAFGRKDERHGSTSQTRNPHAHISLARVLRTLSKISGLHHGMDPLKPPVVVRPRSGNPFASPKSQRTALMRSFTRTLSCVTAVRNDEFVMRYFADPFQIAVNHRWITGVEVSQTLCGVHDLKHREQNEYSSEMKFESTSHQAKDDVFVPLLVCQVLHDVPVFHPRADQPSFPFLPVEVVPRERQNIGVVESCPYTCFSQKALACHVI